MSSPSSRAKSKADLLSRFQERREDDLSPDVFKFDDSQDLDLSFSKFSHVSCSSAPKHATADSPSSKHTASPFLKKIQMSVSNLQVDAFPSKPDVSKPGISKPGISKPGISEPGISEPGISEPGILEPGISKPGISKPDILPKPPESSRHDLEHLSGDFGTTNALAKCSASEDTGVFKKLHPDAVKNLDSDVDSDVDYDDSDVDSEVKRVDSEVKRADPNGVQSLDAGRLDTGRLDTGRLDPGRLDPGRLDPGHLHHIDHIDPHNHIETIGGIQNEKVVQNINSAKDPPLLHHHSVFASKEQAETPLSASSSDVLAPGEPVPAVQVSLTPAQRVEKHQASHNINALVDFEIYEKIGRGAFADVYRGVNIKTKSVVAIKQINLDKDYDIGALMGEIDLLKILKHPNIVKYHGFVKTPCSLNVFLEYCQNGSLRQIYKKLGRGFSEARIVSYVQPILRGLEYLHEQGVVHRDVKAANVLIDASGGVKLADFGVATKVASSHNTIVGTPNWMAPESVLGGDGICTASDIWSLGATVLELFTTHPPYHDLNPMAALHAIGTDEHPPIPVAFSPIARDFLLECFQKQPSLRTGATLLLKHRWLNLPNATNTIRDSGDYRNASGDSTSEMRQNPQMPRMSHATSQTPQISQISSPMTSQNVSGVVSMPPKSVTSFSRAQLLQKFSESDTEVSESSVVLSSDNLKLALSKGNREVEEQDPFLELDINNFDTNELEVQMKMAYLLSKLVTKVALCQSKSESAEKSLVKITGRILHLVEKYPISHDTLIHDHGVLTLMELLENTSELHDDHKLWFHVLGILNCIFDNNIAQIENFSLLGGIPMIIRFSKLSFGLKVRLQVAKFVKTLRKSEKALLMFVSSGGLRILSRFLEEDFETSPDFPLVAINCIHEILANDITRFKSDMCRILSKYGVLFWFVVLLNRLIRYDQSDTHYDQAEISQVIDKILEVIKFFGQAEVRVRINISNPDLFKLLIKVYPALNFSRQLALLKFFRSISCISEILRPLASADILEFYVALLRQYVPSNSHYKEVVNIVCPSLYNCCYLNRTREAELAKLGAIPLLRDLSKINLPFRQFVLPILCELVYCKSSVRQLLVKYDVVTVYYNLLVDPYWHFNAMDSILYWNSQDPKFEILSSPIARYCIVSGFMMTKVSNLEAVLENYLRLLTTNKHVVRLMSRDSVVDSILVKLAVYKKSPAAKVTLLRLLHCILAYAWGSGHLSVAASTIREAMHSALADPSILVKDLARRISDFCV